MRFVLLLTALLVASCQMPLRTAHGQPFDDRWPERWSKPNPGGIVITPSLLVPSLDYPAGRAPTGDQVTGHKAAPFDVVKPEPVVIRYDRGGKLQTYADRYRGIIDHQSEVKVVGTCMSGCTLVLSVPKERLCFGEGSQLLFHAAWDDKPGKPKSDWGTRALYLSYPYEIQAWIDRKGGWQAMTPTDWWVLNAEDFWKMGYRKCGP